ncbi:MAG: glycosyl transferase family 1 [Ardenticatenia bacterium]|jgi:glycosyltransferase involved in cell wall biosynthesis|nr:MAG: glycosyl transferase family 1 [Ardenticatenia bacterium]
MKVGLLTGEYPPMQGGVGDHTRHLAHHLSSLGVEVGILTSCRAVPPDTTSGIAVYPVITGWRWQCWPQITRWLDVYQPDVLHIQYQAAAYDLAGWINGLPWWLRLRQQRPRVVVTFHDLRVPYLFPKAGPLRRWSILVLARYADGVITTNLEDEQVLRRYPWATHVWRIPLGSNIEVRPPDGYDQRNWRARLGIRPTASLLAYFGFLNPSKGGEELVQTLDALVRNGYDAHLLMIGAQVGDVDATNQAYLGRVRQRIRACGLEARVHWTGHIAPEEVSAGLLAADVVVMPYRDGVSFRRTTFIAALRHGCAVVTTSPAVKLSELQDGENVLLVPCGDVDALTQAVTRLLQDSTLATRLRIGAQALGRTFDWGHIAHQTYALYQEVLA